jgi:hypothetical protein
LVVSFTFIVAATNLLQLMKHFCVVLFGLEDSMIILFVEELITNGIDGLGTYRKIERDQ